MKYKTRKAIISFVLCSLVFWNFVPLVQAGWFDTLKSTAGRVQGFSSVPGLSGASKGTVGSKVPVFDEATDELKKKEVGANKISVPGTKGFLGVSVSWDKLAWELANMAIHKITKDIVGWIQTGGRNGKPLFITNWEDFLKDVGNEASGIFIEELELTEICQPFKPRLQLLLGGGGGTYRQRAQCTIKDVASNVENFYRDFKQGGWERWFEITMVPQNNFYGAYYISLEEKLLRESLSVETKKLEAIAGGGFLGYEECRVWAKKKNQGGTYPNDFVGPLPCLEYEIITPGKTIERQLNDVLSPPSGEKRLEVADEIDEIISAAFTRLLTNIRGKSNSGGKKQGIISSEPLKQFKDETETDVSTAIQWVFDALELPQAISLSQQTSATKQDSISKINQLIDVIESINSCQNATSESQVKEQKNRIKLVEKDIENLATITTQLEVGEKRLAGSKFTDEVYELYSELKDAVDIVISLYNSAAAENNSIAGEIESAQSELETCQKNNQQ